MPPASDPKPPELPPIGEPEGYTGLELAQTLTHGKAGVYDAAFSADGKKVTTIFCEHPAWDRNGVQTWDVGTGKPRWVETVPYGCWRREVFDLRFKSVTEPLQNPSELHGRRKAIARAMTVLRAREQGREAEPRSPRTLRRSGEAWPRRGARVGRARWPAARTS